MAFRISPGCGLIGAALVSVVLSLLYRHIVRARKPYPLPPGPPAKLLVGNLGQLSVDHPEQDYIRWGKQYKSDVIYTKVLGQHMVALNSVQAATDLLDRRGANYCDRPRFTLFEVMGWGLTLTFLRWGARFKLHRRMFQSAFSQSNIKAFHPVQLHESRKAVRSLVKDPDSWNETTLLWATSIIFSISYGQEIESKDSKYCHMSQAASRATADGGIAGTTLVDVFPLARFLPNWINPSAALRHARASRTAIRAIHDVPWAANMKSIEAGTARPSFMKTHWEKLVGSVRTGTALDMTEADVKGATGAICIAGGNSTWALVLSCMLFLTKYPAVQKKMQAEIDRVLHVEGRARLPTFDDRKRLPCIDDFIMETMRCLPLNPLIIPHRSLQDDVYKGMLIPAGTTVFANATAISTSPETYARPDVFDPERYSRGEPLPHGNFGYGRRKCPGNWLALASVYMFLATFLATFELEQAVDEEGKPKVPEPGVTVGIGGHPAPFECKPRIRSREMARLLMMEA